jgi:NitT/TauT family transport system permease protein
VNSGPYRHQELFAGLLVMCVYVTGLNALLWRRLYRLAETRFALA